MRKIIGSLFQSLDGSRAPASGAQRSIGTTRSRTRGGYAPVKAIRKAGFTLSAGLLEFVIG